MMRQLHGEKSRHASPAGQSATFAHGPAAQNDCPTSLQNTRPWPGGQLPNAYCGGTQRHAEPLQVSGTQRQLRLSVKQNDPIGQLPSHAG